LGSIPAKPLILDGQIRGFGDSGGVICEGEKKGFSSKKKIFFFLLLKMYP